jgi:DNA polymerase-3 subunit chi
MAEIWFYHLTGRSLESALPNLLERSLARGWRAVVEAGDEERLRALDDQLWTFSDESFLAHGLASEGDADLQPVLLTCGPENLNGADVRFFVAGAELRVDPNQSYARLVLMFDGGDEVRVVAAREQWKELKEKGENLSYWRQGDDGRWEKLG